MAGSSEKHRQREKFSKKKWKGRKLSGTKLHKNQIFIKINFKKIGTNNS